MEESDSSNGRSPKRQKTIPKPWVLLLQQFEDRLVSSLRDQSFSLAQTLKMQREMFSQQLKMQKAQIVERNQAQLEEFKKLLQERAAAMAAQIMQRNLEAMQPPPFPSNPFGPSLGLGRCGYGNHLWNKKSTTQFGRQFQYLRGHDLFCNHFQEEFELNFQFETPQEMLATWKRYHPNGKQWRSIQNLTIRTICRRHIYLNPPAVRKGEDQLEPDLIGLETCEDFRQVPMLSQAEHEEIWSGFEHLGQCHFEWSVQALKLWYEYELQLQVGSTKKPKRSIEKEVLKLDSLLRSFIPTANPNGYVMILWGTSTIVQPINGVPTPVNHPAMAAPRLLPVLNGGMNIADEVKNSMGLPFLPPFFAPPPPSMPTIPFLLPPPPPSGPFGPSPFSLLGPQLSPFTGGPGAGLPFPMLPASSPNNSIPGQEQQQQFNPFLFPQPGQFQN